jgi:signal transduction histidine kinase
LTGRRRGSERGSAGCSGIAGDLHDSVSQSLFSTTLHVRTAQRALAREGFDVTGPVGEELRSVS